MSHAYRDVLGTVAVIIAIVAWVPYCRDLLRHRTVPHGFSWLVWGILSGIGYVAQVSGHAGPGAWVTGLTALVCLLIALFALRSGRTRLVLLDWLSLAAATAALALWFITRGSIISVVLITVADALGYLPTFRKSFSHPRQETLSTFFLSGLKWVVALGGLDHVSLVTALYPLSLILMNWLLVALLVVRRRQIREGPPIAA